MPHPQPNVADEPIGPPVPPRLWPWVVAIGVGAGLGGGGLMVLLGGVGRLAWGPDDNLLTAAGHSSAWHRVAVLTVAGGVVGVGRPLVRRLAGGGGDVTGAIWFRGGRVPVAVTVAKAVQSIVAVGLGMSLGREAAVKDVGGAVGSWLCDRAGRLGGDHRRVLVACGVGAGMAAAYNVPLGGAAFAVEVLLGTASLSVVLAAVTTSTVAVVVSWVALPTGPAYAVQAMPLTAAAVGWAVVAGPAFGVAAAAVVRVTSWSAARRPPWWAAVPTLAGLGVVSIWLPQLLGNGKDATQLAFDGRIGRPMLAVLPAAKLAAVAACLACGGRGGLFTPTLMVGATLGGLLAWHVDPALAAAIGAGAVLAAASRGPVSAVVLVLELTRHGDATMVPLLAAVLGATLVAGRLEPATIYSARAQP